MIIISLLSILNSEWAIGTADKSQDLFPAIKVGKDTSGSASIVRGKLHFNMKYTNKTVSEFLDTRNMTSQDTENRTYLSDREKSFFNMEPGRCIYQSLNAIGFSHIKSKIEGKKICVKRKYL